MSTYLMSPNIFHDLTQVRGFTEMNGKTYAKHICIIFDSQLTEDQKEKIKSKVTTQAALDYLRTLVKYTHLME